MRQQRSCPSPCRCCGVFQRFLNRYSATGISARLWRIERQWEVPLSPTGIFAFPRMLLRGFPEPPSGECCPASTALRAAVSMLICSGSDRGVPGAPASGAAPTDSLPFLKVLSAVPRLLPQQAGADSAAADRGAPPLQGWRPLFSCMAPGELTTGRPRPRFPAHGPWHLRSRALLSVPLSGKGWLGSTPADPAGMRSCCRVWDKQRPNGPLGGAGIRCNQFGTCWFLGCASVASLPLDPGPLRMSRRCGNGARWLRSGPSLPACLSRPPCWRATAPIDSCTAAAPPGQRRTPARVAPPTVLPFLADCPAVSLKPVFLKFCVGPISESYRCAWKP